MSLKSFKKNNKIITSNDNNDLFGDGTIHYFKSFLNYYWVNKEIMLLVFYTSPFKRKIKQHNSGVKRKDKNQKKD